MRKSRKEGPYQLLTFSGQVERPEKKETPCLSNRRGSWAAGQVTGGSNTVARSEVGQGAAGRQHCPLCWAFLLQPLPRGCACAPERFPVA